MSQATDWRAETRDIIESLLNDGSNPDAEYTIEHHFSGQNFARLEKAAVDCFKAGYEVTDAEELTLERGQTLLCFDAVAGSALDEEQIMQQIEELLPIAEKYGIDYDGWGTYFEEGEEEE
ncbi:ribonuclease E inhibitor RraB [Oceanimonas pelagia]|uniref:Regulator of ribonuclease activity B n=1 Tax=Oceanimonas pelagia TaxID=3028314 RepID=A0AA50KL33_9GAMM|nr:ribonuclease E inhibitor RraB [Oceanimonas pelagia]WMC10111.1 ribonuclease E inhibitor RraB [Oceanimonas pelagia]